jgi:hypothetical protein
LKHFRCGAGEDGQDQSNKTHENEVIHGVRKKEICYIQQKEGRLTGLIKSCADIAF